MMMMKKEEEEYGRARPGGADRVSVCGPFPGPGRVYVRGL